MITACLCWRPGARAELSVPHRVLQEECGCSLKHKAGFIHKELERISLGPSGGTKSRGAVKRPAPSAAEDSLMSEVRRCALAKPTPTHLADISGVCSVTAEVAAGGWQQEDQN